MAFLVFPFDFNKRHLSKPSELASPRADLIRQIFWYCQIVETYVALFVLFFFCLSFFLLFVHFLLLTSSSHFNIELGLPLTGLDRFEDLVGLPDFSGPCSQDDYLANQASHFQEHYASQIVLRRLCVAFHNSLSFGKIPPFPSSVSVFLFYMAPPKLTTAAQPPAMTEQQQQQR